MPRRPAPQLTNLRRSALSSTYVLIRTETAVRSCAWSPAGCSAHGGCLLGVVTTDHRVGAGVGGFGGGKSRAERSQGDRLPAPLRLEAAVEVCGGPPGLPYLPKLRRSS